MGKIINILLSLFILVGCDITPHNVNEIEFYFLNKTSSGIQYKTSYDGIESRYLTIEINGKEYTGGGGILEIDSIVFIKINTLDTIKFVNGSNSNVANDVFNTSSWVKKEHNNYYYTLTDEDFE
ncbi:hypothetical protein [Mangrovivirga cuniculi]|uniref:Lipoprotein n=1 Tax=Mangrovivirga cuniculi TaxID=2715131 RepID=A0A4D7JUI0_9BACT|nr:hypothetical protein [Mangrovivirga cuniculi]QCK16252.1 hypothetical protein DCC35_16640 [Mangrovivirga cuniculi]